MATCSSRSTARRFASALSDSLPRANLVNGRFVSPWDSHTKKTFTNILNGIVFKSKTLKLKSPKWTTTHKAIRVHHRRDILESWDTNVEEAMAMHLTWLGHSTTFLQLDGLNFITDPVWYNRVSPMESLGPSRFMPPPVEIEDLPSIDVVLLSHSHYDHLDLSAAARIGNRALWIVPLGLKHVLSSILGITNCIELNWWQSFRIRRRDRDTTVDVTLTPTQHWSARTLFDRNTTLWGSFAVRSASSSFFFGGDTAYCDCFKTIGDVLGPFDLAAIPIGAYKPRELTKHVHCDPAEAVQIHKDLRARQSLGIHWGTYPLTEEDAVEPPLELRRAREEANVSVSEFFTASQGLVIKAGHDAELDDFAMVHSDLYSLYLEQIWSKQVQEPSTNSAILRPPS